MTNRGIFEPPSPLLIGSGAMSSFIPYAPLNVPKPFGERIWIPHGPDIRMVYGPASITLPTRITVVLLAAGRHCVHSPTATYAVLLVSTILSLSRLRVLAG